MNNGNEDYRGPLLPTVVQADTALQEARHLFSRTLATWTGDVLELRRRGMLGMQWGDQLHRMTPSGSDRRRAA